MTTPTDGFDYERYRQRRRENFAVEARITNDPDFGKTISVRHTENGRQWAAIELYPEEWQQVMQAVLTLIIEAKEP